MAKTAAELSLAEARPSRRSVPFVFYSLGLVILIVFVLWVARSIFVPFVVAVLLSFLIVSVKEAIDRVPVVGRYLPGTVSYILAFGLIAAIILTLALVIRENVSAVLEKAPDYQARFSQIVSGFVTWAEGMPIIPAEATRAAEELLDGLGRGIMPGETLNGENSSADAASIRRQVFTAVRGTLGAVSSAAGNFFGNLVTVFLYTAFLLVERGRMGRKLTRMAGRPSLRRQIDAVLDDVSNLVRTYLSMKSLINLSVAMISFVIMTLIGTDFAGFWALLIFLFGYVPIVGAVIAISMPTLLTLVQPGGGVGPALLTLVLLTGAEQAISSVVEPRVMGRSLNLSPLAILLALACWGAVWGVAGMLLSVPLTVVVLIVLSQFQTTRPIAILLSDNGEIAPIRRTRR